MINTDSFCKRRQEGLITLLPNTLKKQDSPQAIRDETYWAWRHRLSLTIRSAFSVFQKQNSIDLAPIGSDFPEGSVPVIEPVLPDFEIADPVFEHPERSFSANSPIKDVSDRFIRQGINELFHDLVFVDFPPGW